MNKHTICGSFLMNINIPTPSWDFIPVIMIVSALFPQIDLELSRTVFLIVGTISICSISYILIKFYKPLIRNTSLDKMLLILAILNVLTISLGTYNTNLLYIGSLSSIILLTFTSIIIYLRSNCWKRKTDGPEIYKMLTK